MNSIYPLSGFYGEKHLNEGTIAETRDYMKNDSNISF